MESRLEYEDERVQAKLRALGDLGKNTKPLTRVWAGILHDEVEENFAQEGRPKWKSLYPATIKRRQKKGYWPGKILQQRGDLARSIVPSSTDEEARVSTNKVYARILHLGGTIKRYARSTLRAQKRGGSGRFKKGFEKEGHGHTSGEYEIDVPARPFMTLTSRGVEKILEAGRKWIRDGLNGGGAP